VPGTDNPVADALSRVDSIMMPIIDTEELAQEQTTDEEFQRVLQSFSSNLKLQKFLLSKTNSIFYCDCFQNNVRLFVPVILYRRVFDMASHPSRRATRRQIVQKFVWMSTNKDITAWAKTCFHC